MGKTTRWLRSLFGIKKGKDSGDRRENKRGDSGGLCENPATIPPNITVAEAAWLRSFYGETDKEQNKHAIAVAAATAAAADAAVAAAQAAVAVVRLTSHGRGTPLFGNGREKWAAVKIQVTFRGYLARKALKALKGLVKLQALVRGFLVRKQATATLLGMQALIRAQGIVRAQKAASHGHDGYIQNYDYFYPHSQVRKSMERFDDTRSEYITTIHSRRLSSSFDTNMNSFDESSKIVEVDTCRPKSKSKRPGEDPLGPILSSHLPSRNPARLSIPDCRNFHNSDWGLTGDECRFSTAQSTPRFTNGPSGPVTPAKSVCAEAYYSGFPNYMANTQSFRAKLRSQSAPKQRPDNGLGPKKRLSLNELMESRNSLSGVKMQRSCSQAKEVINFKNAVMGKLDRSSDFA